MSEAELSASDIYLQKEVVFEKGKKYLIKANSGHGKSSVLNFIYGSSHNYTGEVVYSKKEDSVFSLRQTEISYVFQDFKLFPSLTLFENIQLKNKLTHHKSTEQIDALINKMQLTHRRDSLVETLSLGQRQRVAIIRALCQPFNFLLLDEPFSHLDSSNIKIIVDVLNKELEERQASVIITALDDLPFFEFDKTINL
ncbi:ATP-binding cassette domain-containing protein [Winogradskyella marincola]|uniref:ATP-binding cassette domain-containing protein n=1 Tax=Winogradskyella marincola TaxID=3037795 RepID=A0ABT6G3S2_9FLAO|nr:ATP-binding cassette domain-containing protein [Winogradskyella sp. YYF002]MDG4716552.1 ATP-binding cassette domain-containing protein [Winogradskyella sp. YYF002]